jgi:hypothetical protein
VDESVGGDHPIEGPAVLIAAAKASVPGDRLPALLAAVQTSLEGELATYRRRFECVAEDADRAVFLADDGHWGRLGERLGFNDRETDAARRAHTQQLRRLGSRTDRREEFETALEIREAVVLGTG